MPADCFGASGDLHGNLRIPLQSSFPTPVTAAHGQFSITHHPLSPAAPSTPGSRSAARGRARPTRITGVTISGRWRSGWSSRRCICICICIRIARSRSACRNLRVFAAKARVSEHQQVDDDDGDRCDDHPVHAAVGHQYARYVRKSEQAREVGDREDLRAC